MSGEGDRLYSKNPFFLRLKGPVTVHFMDGQTLAGEFTTQDEFHVFLTVEEEPVMIPRGQIRYIQGERGQRIEVDTSQAGLGGAGPVRVETLAPEPVEFEQAGEIVEIEPVSEQDGEDRVGTFVAAPVVSEAYPVDKESDLLAPARADLEEVGTTRVLSSEEMTKELVAPLEDDDGGTLVIEPAISPPPEEAGEAIPTAEEDDDTFVLGQSETAEEVSAHLICTIGPHAGEVYQLKRGVMTLGRASDNTFAFPKDKEMSRRHALIMYEAGKFLIQDQNSLNGTLVNDELIGGSRPLEDGDHILVGISTLKYQEK